MIGKVITGKSFGGCIRYNLQREKATILYADGIRTGSIGHIINDFNMHRKMNPGLGQAVGHIVLSWSVQDKNMLTSNIMADRAKEYLEKMKIVNTQCLVVQHHDREHPHIHIVYNRVNNEAKTISDQYQRKRNVEVCKQITLKHGYYLAKGKGQVNRHRLTGADKIKYELYDTISRAAAKATNWTDLEILLKQQGIGVQFKYKSGTDQVQGISFNKGELKYKGSEIDRSLSYNNLNRQIELNNIQTKGQSQSIESHHEEETEVQELRNRTSEVNILSDLLQSEKYEESVDFHLTKRKKAKHNISQGRSL